MLKEKFKLTLLFSVLPFILININVIGFSTAQFNLNTTSEQFDSTSLTSYQACVSNSSEDYFTGWSFTGETPIDTELKSAGGDYETSITVKNQTSSNSQTVFLGFSKGSCGNIELRRNLIQNNNFLTNPFPTFSYKMSQSYNIDIFLEYDKLNILNDHRFAKGKHQVSLTYKNQSSGNINMKFEVM